MIPRLWNLLGKTLWIDETDRVSDLGALLSTVLAVTTIVGVGLAGLAYGTTKTLRESNGDLRSALEDERQKGEQRDKKIAELQADRDALARVATGQQHWEQLTEKLDEHHEESMSAWSALGAAMGRLEAAIREHRRGTAR